MITISMAMTISMTMSMTISKTITIVISMKNKIASFLQNPFML